MHNDSMHIPGDLTLINCEVSLIPSAAKISNVCLLQYAHKILKKKLFTLIITKYPSFTNKLMNLYLCLHTHITGHIHGHHLGNYNGVRYVNSSTWQSQTEFQKMMNFAPDPCILTMFDLNSRQVVKKDFK